MSDDNSPVVYLMPDGTEVSNDPRFFQNQMQEQLAAQQVHVREATEAGPNANVAPVPDEVGKSTIMGNGEATPLLSSSSDSSDSAEVELPANFDELKGKELQALAKDLRSKGVEIDTAGVTKVGDLRNAIRTGVENYDPNAEDPDLDDDEN